MSDWPTISSIDISKVSLADRKDFAAKWPGLVERGYVQVPRCLIACTPQLKLTAQEARVLFIIMDKIWARGDVSWQTVNTIAKSAGMGNSTVRSITKSLQEKGFIKKEQRWNTSNTYSVEPALKKVQEHLPFCDYTAQNQAHVSQNVSGTDISFPSDYIEPVLTKTDSIEPNNSPNSINGAVGDSSNHSIEKYEYALCWGNNSDRHTWRESFSSSGDSEDTVYFYTCINDGCPQKYSKKGERPWPANYPYE
jgi:hypothetical protein